MQSKFHRSFGFGGMWFNGAWTTYEGKSGDQINAWLLIRPSGGLLAVPLDVLDEMFDFFRPESKSHIVVDLIFEPGESAELGVRVCMPTRHIPRPQSASNEFYFSHREMPTNDWVAPYCPAALLGDGTIISIQAGEPKHGGGHYSQPSDNEADFYNLFSVSEMPGARGFGGAEGAYIPHALLDQYIEDHGGIVGTARFEYGKDEPVIALF